MAEWVLSSAYRTYRGTHWYALVRALRNNSRCPVFRLTAIGWIIKLGLLHHENEYVRLWAVSQETGQRHFSARKHQ